MIFGVLATIYSAFALVSFAGVHRDVGSDDELTVGASALGVHGALQDALALAVREVSEQPEAQHPHQPPRACRDRVLLVRDSGSRRRWWPSASSRSQLKNGSKVPLPIRSNRNIVE